MFLSSHQLQKSWRECFFHEWKCLGGLLAWLQSSWIDYVVVQHFSRSVTMFFLCFTTNGVLQVLAFLFLILCGVSVHNFDCLYMYACQLKIVTVLSWEHFQVLIFCMVIACSFPFLPLLRHYVLLPWKYSIGNNAWHTWHVCALRENIACGCGLKANIPFSFASCYTGLLATRLFL